MSTVKKGSGICDFHIFSPGENKEHISVSDLVKVFEKIPGGYKYLGAASTRYYFPLKEGGELRFFFIDDDVCEDAVVGVSISIDYYDSGILPGVTGPAYPTG